MEDIKSKKIRDVLKAIYSQFNENKIEEFIFTTFDFDVDFFEEHIVSYLMNTKRKITTVKDLNEANDWLKKNHVCVYYDKSALNADRPCTTLRTYPQKKNKPYVFHPKVIILYGETGKGKKEAYLMVSSSNLTVSGYGRNQEIFSYLKVESQIIADEISAFIKDLSKGDNDRHKAILDYLKNGKFNKNEDIRFFWNHNEKKQTLASYIHEQKPNDIKIISPYFDSDGPKKLLENIGVLHEDSNNKVIIIPTKNGNYFNITKDYYKDLVSRNVKFSEMKTDKDRFIHAKLIQFNDYLVIGSYNFTHAALGGFNSEAALIYKNVNPVFDIQDIKNSNQFLDTKISSSEEEGVTSNEDIFITVEIDWKAEEQVKVHFEYSGKEKYWTLYLGSMGFNDSENDKQNFLADSEDFKKIDFTKKMDDRTKESILKNKTFRLYKAGHLCTTGLIIEKNWEESRPKISCESFYDAVKEWWPDDGSKEEGRNTDPLLFPEDGATEELFGILKETSMDVFDNYFYLSKSFENMIRDIKESISKEDSKKLKDMLVLQPGCIKNLIDLLEKLYNCYLNEKKENDDKTKQTDLVYCWLGGKYISYILEKIMKYSKFGIETIRKDLSDKHKVCMVKIENEVQNILGIEEDSFYCWITNYFDNKRYDTDRKKNVRKNK